jgi:hypothetical protein
MARDHKSDKGKRRRVKKIKRAIEKVAFISLIADIAIAITTIISLNTGHDGITIETIFILNYLLTVIVIIAVVLFAALFLLIHYDRMYDALLLKRLRKGLSRRAKH